MIIQREVTSRPKNLYAQRRSMGLTMEATTQHILEELIQEFSAIKGIELEPSDTLLLRSFVEEIQAAGGLSTLEAF